IPLQAIEALFHLVRLEEHLIDLQRREVRTEYLQSLADLLAKADRIDLTALSNQADQHCLLAVKPGPWLRRLKRTTPDVSYRSERNAPALRQVNLSRSQRVDTGELTIGQHAETLARRYNKSAGNHLVAPCQQFRQ